MKLWKELNMKTSRENFIGSAVLVIEEYSRLKLSFEKVSEIIGNKMEDEWTDFEYDEVSIFMDTCARERVADIVSNYYLGRDWPSYYEKVDIEEFLELLEQKVKESELC